MLSAAGLAATFGCVLVLRRYAHRTDVLSKLLSRAARPSRRRGLGSGAGTASGTRDRANELMIEWDLPQTTPGPPAIELVT